MSKPLHRHPSRREIIDLAAAEGHDADITSNAGSLRRSPSCKRTCNPEAFTPCPLDQDPEKGLKETSISSEERIEGSPNDDPNIVSWDGPDDPHNPMNWPFAKKWATVSLVSAITFLTPLASSIFAPGVPQVMETFNSTDDMLAGFMISIYVLGFAIGPMIIAPLSEMYGRLPLYHICNTLFVLFCIAAALATNMGMFITFRFFMGCFGGAPMVLGGGTIADLIDREQRGTAMVVWMMGPTLGPCVGPIVGGFLTQKKGWRWNFWFVAIIAGVFLILSGITMNETSAPVILERKAKRLRTSTGNSKLRSMLASELSTKDLFKFSIVRPIRMLTRSYICLAMSVYIAVTYSYLYILFTTFTVVFQTQYGWHGGVMGLSFLGLGTGSIIGQSVFTHYGNKTAAKHIARGDFKPEHRLYLMAVGGPILPIGLFWYGWSVHAQAHFMVPLVGTGIIGFGLLLTFMPASTYLVDCFTLHAASAMAASTVLRSLSGALVPLSSQRMYAATGYGWGNSLLAFVSLLLVPIPLLFIKYGERIRTRNVVNF